LTGRVIRWTVPTDVVHLPGIGFPRGHPERVQGATHDRPVQVSDVSTHEPIPIESARYRANKLLARVDSSQFATLTAAARIVPLNVGAVIHEPESTVEQVYFPLGGTVSMVSQSTEGTMVEAATIGNEGTTGVPVFLVGDVGPLEYIAQVAGEAAVIPAGVFRAELRDGTSLVDTMRRYTHAQMVQTAQTAMCNRLHELEERSARWLLQTHDRVAGDRFGLTHEFMSIMLGVRRPTVTVALGTLERAGMIAASRGVIEIIDRAGLEASSCECYAVITEEYRRLLE
jgi:CRP-like cAMP-binding protein